MPCIISTLEEVGTLLAASTDLTELERRLPRALEAMLEVEYAGMYFYEQKDQRLRLFWTHGFTPDEHAEAERTAMARHPGRVFRTGEVLWVDDVREDTRTVDSSRSFEVRSRLFLPVTSRAERVGVFGLASSRLAAFSDEDVACLGFLANIAGVVYTQLRATEAREALEREIEHTARLAALGKLAGGVAHAINNQLKVVRGTLSVMLLGGSEKLFDDDLTTMLRAVEEAAAVTRRLQTFAPQQVARVRVDLNEEVERFETLFQPALPRGIRLRVRAPGSPVHVFAPEQAAQQILLNLVNNALDAMPKGGTLSIMLDASDELEAVLRVSDNGEGMTQCVRERAFEPFFTTQPEGSAAGLGLASVHGLVQQCAGVVQITSTLGEGTTITVRLPRSNPQLGQARPIGARLAATVLVVDDEPAILRLCQRILERRGMTVFTSRSGEEAEALACTEHIDLLVTDVVMPGVYGPTLARRVRKRLPGLPVLVMSGNAAESLADMVTEGPTGFLPKPYTAEALWCSVVDVMGKSAAVRAVPSH